MFVLVEVSVSTDAFSGGVGVGQQSVRTVKGVVVSVLCRISDKESQHHSAGTDQQTDHRQFVCFYTSGSEADHDVSDSLVQLLEGQRCDIRPDI